jgi:hypothetical protein
VIQIERRAGLINKNVHIMVDGERSVLRISKEGLLARIKLATLILKCPSNQLLMRLT